MNDDPEPSFAARQQQQHIPDGESSRRDPIDEQQSTALNNNSAQDDDDEQTSRQERRKAGLKKKLQFMSHLQRNLDMIFFAYLCTLYYMEYEYNYCPQVPCFDVMADHSPVLCFALQMFLPPSLCSHHPALHVHHP